MLELAQDAGIPAVVSTVAVNNSESSPFVSLPSENRGDANSHFLRGKELLQEARHEESASEFRCALELDGLRFRADVRINEIIREATTEFPNAHLAKSAESLFPGGRELFFEHVHLTFEGNNAIA